MQEKSSSELLLSKRVNHQILKIKNLKEEIRVLRDENSLLKSRLKPSVSPSPSSKTISAEHSLYRKVIEAYERAETKSLEKSIKIFLKAYPKSVHADNALYLLSVHYYKNGQFSDALKISDKIIRDFPNSNKLESAYFIKGVIYKNLNLNTQAINTFKRIIKIFPGSSEALKSRAHLESLSHVKRGVAHK